MSVKVTRGAGYEPDPDEIVKGFATTFPLSRLVGTGRRPERVSHRALLDGILDQGPLECCVGVSFSTAMYLRGQLSTPIRRPSSKLIWDLARLADNEDLFNIGCRALGAYEMLRKHGVVADEHWPLFTEDEALLALRPEGKEWMNTPPDFTVFHQAADAVLTGAFYIDDDNDESDIVATLEQSLNVGQIPLFAMWFKPEFGEVRGTELYDRKQDVDKKDPAHMQAICGYDEQAFEVVSSWGTNHGDNGIVRVAKSFLASNHCRNRMVVTHVPTAKKR